MSKISKKNKIVIVGSNGKLGSQLRDFLIKKGEYVIGISKNIDHKTSNSFTINHNSKKSYKETFEIILKQSPKAVIFCHRVRNLDSDDDLKEYMNQELLPYIALKEAFRNIKTKNTFNVVSYSSVCTQNWNKDVSYAYHIVKAASEQAALGLAFLKNDNLKIFSNIILFGEYKNIFLNSHEDEKSKLFDEIINLNPSKLIVDSNHLLETTYRLCFADNCGINVQRITVDAGLNSVSIESYLRSII